MIKIKAQATVEIVLLAVVVVGIVFFAWSKYSQNSINLSKSGNVNVSGEHSFLNTHPNYGTSGAINDKTVGNGADKLNSANGTTIKEPETAGTSAQLVANNSETNQSNNKSQTVETADTQSVGGKSTYKTTTNSTQNNTSASSQTNNSTYSGKSPFEKMWDVIEPIVVPPVTAAVTFVKSLF